MSSAWEGEWLTNADDLAAKEAMCPTMRASADLAALWLADVAACKQDAAACWPALPDRVFSKFVKECWSTVGPSGLRIGGGRGMLVEERIERPFDHMPHVDGGDFIVTADVDLWPISCSYWEGRSVPISANCNTDQLLFRLQSSKH